MLVNHAFTQVDFGLEPVTQDLCLVALCPTRNSIYPQLGTSRLKKNPKHQIEPRSQVRPLAENSITTIINIMRYRDHHQNYRHHRHHHHHGRQQLAQHHRCATGYWLSWASWLHRNTTRAEMPYLHTSTCPRPQLLLAHLRLGMGAH